jgi:prolyl-tRNA synthetase
MRQSQLFYKTHKNAAADEVSVNARYLEQAGYISKLMAGVYTYLPLGLRVLAKVENIIREEMDGVGGQEVLMPALQPKEIWTKTGRWDKVDVLFKLESQHGYQLALGPTHEEVVTPLAIPIIESYRDLPKAVYQLQTKFRDEARAKSGLLRGREFRMKDLYSYHATEEDLAAYYKQVAEAYHRVFNRLGIPALYVEASGGAFTKFSHEFQVEVESGEDVIYVCQRCNLAKNKEVFDDAATCTNCGVADFRETKACEVGNIFELKTRFSESCELYYTDEQGQRQLVQMGCYGIGPSRCMGVIVEKHHDDKGIIWPEAVAPYRVHLIALPGKDGSVVFPAADALYADLVKAGVEVLYDDRLDITPGEKFADSDLLGLPYRLVVSSKTVAAGQVELKARTSHEATMVSHGDVLKALNV